VSRFTEWEPYEHKVRAQLDDCTVPLPINHMTISAVFGARFNEWMDTHDPVDYPKSAASAFLDTLVTHHDPVTNSREHVENSVGVELCDLFFEPYTKKMWGLSLAELPASVAARIPTNVDNRSYLYFPKDKHQYLPADGYTALIERMLSLPNITVRLSTTRQELLNPALNVFWQTELGISPLEFEHIFTSEPIDTYFNCRLGELPWRSVKMHTYTLPLPGALPAAVVNFTHDGPHTRVTEWKQLPGHAGDPHWTTLTFEEPCDYRDNNMERYYPVKTSQADCPNRALYRDYTELAKGEANVTFIGRCGLYAYVDMHQAISSALATTHAFFKEHP
jgi:UDP-galactopyranose mutase